jgi:RNA polymerase sigma factor (sigma-70 family)
VRDDRSVVLLLPAMRAFAQRLSRNPADVDDLVQETLFRTLKSFDRFAPDTQLKSWMFTIMRNAFLTRLHSANREAPGALECVAITSAMEASQEWCMETREVLEAIDRLPAHYRDVILLIGVSGVSYDEAARICGCNIGTVKSRLNRARMQVLEQLGEPAGKPNNRDPPLT